MNIQEIMARPQEITWLPWAVQYFFMIGISTCCALYACWQRWRGDKRDARLELLTIFLAITLGIAAPLALTADVHQTARIWHFYAYPTPWSWMPWGAVFLPLYTGCLGVYFLALLADKIWKKQFRITRWMALGSAIFAIGLLAYTGREVSVVRANPIWFSYWIPVLLFFSAMQVVPSLLALGTRREPQYQNQMARWQIVSLLLLAICMGFWIAGNTVSGAAMRAQLSMDSIGWWLAVAVSLLWVVILILAINNSNKNRSVVYITIQAFLSMILAWSLRWMLLMQVQTIPKYNVMYNPYQIPLGMDGLLAIIGTFGLWIALMIIVREGVRWFDAKIQTNKLKNSKTPSTEVKNEGMQHG